MLLDKIGAVNHGKKQADKNRYCGPAAISAVTGQTTGEVARLIRKYTGRSRVTGTGPSDLRAVFRNVQIDMQVHYDSWLYWTAKFKHNGQAPTLAAWLKKTRPIRKSADIFLILTTNHWQVVQGNRIVCSQLGEPTRVSSNRVKRRQRVRQVYTLAPKAVVTHQDFIPTIYPYW